MRYLPLSLLLASGLCGCTWVELEPGARAVAVAGAQDIAECEHLSHVSANVVDGVGFLSRSEDKVARELATIARNEGARLGGDTVVPASSINDGRQHFSVYRCRQ